MQEYVEHNYETSLTSVLNIKYHKIYYQFFSLIFNLEVVQSLSTASKSMNAQTKLHVRMKSTRMQHSVKLFLSS